MTTIPDNPDQGPGEHDAHLMDDDRTRTVPCAHCGQPIWEYAQRCTECGIHFQGEAWEFGKTSRPGRKNHLPIVFVVGIVLIVVAYLLGNWDF